MSVSARDLIILFLCCFASTLRADQPAVVEEVQPGQVVGQPIVVCPSYIPNSIFVPIDELLAKADAMNPVTWEGVITRNRPVAACGQIPDAATRAEELVHHPTRLRNYESEIRLIKAEIRMLEHRVIEYRYFNKANALYTTAQETDLLLLAARERLRNLRYERMLYIRHRNLEKTLATFGAIVSQEPIAE